MKKNSLSLKIIGMIAVLVLMLAIFSSCGGEEKKISITGSTTVLPIAQKCAEVYMQEKNKDAEITVSGGGSSNGIKALIEGSTDIADASRKIKDSEVEKAKENGVDPYGTVVGRDALAIVVSDDVTGISNISKADLKAIYLGEITNWSQVGGPNLKTLVVSRDTSSGTYETFENLVMDKEEVTKDAMMLASNGAVKQTVKSSSGAVGYVGLSFKEGMTTLTFEGVEISKQAALDGSYPLARNLYMYTDGEPKGAVKKFLDFVTSSEGQKLVEEVGYVGDY